MQKDEHTKKTILTYESIAEDYDKRHYDIEEIREMIDCFMKQLDGTRVLDLGCGPGRDAKYFAEHGLEVTGTDLCKRFIDIASHKAPEANFIHSDMRKLNLPDNSFDGVWACASLLHLPKDEAKTTLKNLHRMLKNGGIIHVSVKEGEGEKIINNDKGERFFAFYTEDELRKMMEACGFEVMDMCRVKDEKRWIGFLGKKR